MKLKGTDQTAWMRICCSQPLEAVILLPAHPASFTHNFISGMHSFYFRESQDAMILQTCHEE